MLNDSTDELTLRSERVDLVYDQYDSNAANFVLGNGYFSIQTSVYLETDEQLNEPFFELNDQDHSQCGGLEAVMFFNDKVQLDFRPDTRFLTRYRSVVVRLKGGVSRKLVDFFNNDLFFGQLIRYSDDFDPRNICAQTSTRELL